MFSLTVDVSSGGGSVQVDVTEYDSYPVTRSFSEGTVVSLQATPSFGHIFRGWSGAVTGSDNPEFITMDCNKQVSAVFGIDWRLVGTFTGSLILIVLFLAVLFIRRKGPESTATADGAG